MPVDTHTTDGNTPASVQLGHEVRYSKESDVLIVHVLAGIYYVYISLTPAFYFFPPPTPPAHHRFSLQRYDNGLDTCVQNPFRIVCFSAEKEYVKIKVSLHNK